MSELDIFEIESTVISGIFYNIGVIASGITTAKIVEANRKGELVELDYKLLTNERVTAVLAMLILEFGRMHSLNTKEILDKISDTLAFNSHLKELPTGPLRVEVQ